MIEQGMGKKPGKGKTAHRAINQKVKFALAAALIAAVLMVPPAAPSAGTGTLSMDITLRVAPTGFVIPAQHWVTDTTVNETTPAVWIIDPASTPTFNNEDGVAGCTLTVSDTSGFGGSPGPDGRIDGGEVLDAATTAGCISGWSSTTHGGFGRSVTMIDDLDEVGWPGPWWQIQVGGELADVGLDGLDLSDGQSLEFVYMVQP